MTEQQEPPNALSDEFVLSTFDREEGLFPYAGTSGWSGSETSEERARRIDKTGVTSKRQRIVLGLVKQRGAQGITVKELRDATGWHHGIASGPLSVLHKEGHLVRLQERRLRCQVYVLPRYVMDRDTSPYHRNAKREEVVYPFEEGGVIVLGPGVFMDKERTTVNVEGVNYYRPEF